jgi:hypothetical protein
MTLKVQVHDAPLYERMIDRLEGKGAEKMVHNRLQRIAKAVEEPRPARDEGPETDEVSRSRCYPMGSGVAVGGCFGRPATRPPSGAAAVTSPVTSLTAIGAAISSALRANCSAIKWTGTRPSTRRGPDRSASNGWGVADLGLWARARRGRQAASRQEVASLDRKLTDLGSVDSLTILPVVERLTRDQGLRGEPGCPTSSARTS